MRQTDLLHDCTWSASSRVAYATKKCWLLTGVNNTAVVPINLDKVWISSCLQCWAGHV